MADSPLKNSDRGEVMKLSCGQLWAVFFAFRAFSLMCSGTGYSVKCFLGVLVSTAVQLAFVLPVTFLLSRKKYISEKCGLIAAFYFIFTGITVFGKFSCFSPAGSPLVLTVLMTAAVLWCRRYELSSCGRTAVVISGLFVIMTAFLILSVSKHMNIGNIASASAEDSSLLVYVAENLREDLFFPVIPVAALLAGRCRTRGITAYFVSSILLSVVIIFAGASVSGAESFAADTPFFSLCSFFTPSGLQRMDAVFLSAFVLCAALCINICSCISSRILKLPPFITVLMIAAGGLVYSGYYTGPAMAAMLAAFIIAGVLFVRRNLNKTEKIYRNL